MSVRSIFSPALDLIPFVKTSEGVILTENFLNVCRYVLPVIDRFGSALSIVKSDIGGNIDRLEKAFQEDTDRFKELFSIVRVEIERGKAKDSYSNTNGLLWLTRAMNFLTMLLKNLYDHRDWTLYEAAMDSYQRTLKKYHGWFASSAFMMALNLCPDRDTFFKKLGEGDLYGDLERFVVSFGSLLRDNQEFLNNEGFGDIVSA